MNYLYWFWHPRRDSLINIQDPNPSSNIVLDEEGSVIELINPLSSPSPLSSFTISQIEWNNPKSPGNGEAVIFFVEIMMGTRCE